MKRTIKKSLSILLLLALCLNFASCSKKKSAAVNEQNTADEQSADSSSYTNSSDDSLNLYSDTGTPANEGTSQSSAYSSKSTGSAQNNNTTQAGDAETPDTSSSTVSNTVNVTVPYGYSLSQIGDVLQTKGVCSKTDFLSTVNSYDFSNYDLIKNIPANDHRCYKLEGYLYPDTYTFYKNSKPQNVIGKMIRGAENNIGSKYSYSGMTTYQIITLASIIQKEVNNTTDMKIVSMIFHNRIKSKMNLNADSTVNYIENYVKPNLTGDINRYNSYYNTNKCIGLPVGPICSPGANALNAAVNPDTNYSDYYYFFTDKSGKAIFSKTNDEQDQKYHEIYG